MLSVRPRQLRLVIQHHEAALMKISCSSFKLGRRSLVQSHVVGHPQLDFRGKLQMRTHKGHLESSKCCQKLVAPAAECTKDET